MLVSFIIVAYNAEDKICSILNDLLQQDYDHKKIEIILVDSASSDHTKKTMEEFRNRHQRQFNGIYVLDNPKRILPSGWNVALAKAQGDVILRVDAHSNIPIDFIRQNVECMKNGEKITGGPRESIIDETSNWQKTLLTAEKSMFGSGIAKYRNSNSEGYVKTLAHAAYHKEVFENAGKYDERLVRTEDNEIHYRMREAGYKFFFTPKIRSFHYARNSLKTMIKQKYLNGYWIGLTMAVSPKCFSFYHFVPFLFIIGIVLTSLLAIFGFNQALTLMWSIYWISAILMSIFSLDKKSANITSILLPILFFILHISYGIGTLVGLIKMPIWIRNNDTL